MRKAGYIGIVFFLIGISFYSCNTEEGVAPMDQATFVKILLGRGEDTPVKIDQMADGSLLVLSNSSVADIEGTQTQVRLTKLSMQGEIIWDRFFPEEGSRTWLAGDMVLSATDEIIIAADSLKATDERNLLFMKVSASGELNATNGISVNEGESVEAKGLVLGENGEVHFTASLEGAENNTMRGTFSISDLSLTGEPFRSANGTASPNNSLARLVNGTLCYSTNNAPNPRLVYGISVEGESAPNPIVRVAGASSSTAVEVISNADGSSVYVIGNATFGGDSEPFVNQYQEGELTFSSIYRNENIDRIRGTFISQENDIWMVGSRQFGVNENAPVEFYLRKVNSNGGSYFERSFGGDDEDIAYDVFATENDIYVVGTTDFADVATLVLLKLDSNGEFTN